MISYISLSYNWATPCTAKGASVHGVHWMDIGEITSPGPR